MAVFLWVLAVCIVLLWLFLRPGRYGEAQKQLVYGVNHAHRGLHTKDKTVPENSLPAFRAAAEAGRLLGGTYFQRVTEEALKVAECNACMKRIVAAPTAGSCGVLPAVLIPLVEVRDVAEETILQALYIAAGFGQVTALRASVAGAEGGCQAEIGTASAMAAAALTHILGGTAQQCADAYAIALGNLLGLVCDPVAGLVEVPCVKRNVIGAVNAVSAANMAVAGITSRIPVDEVIDAMGEVGDALPASLRETGLGGLAATPTGRQAAERIARAEH